MNIFIYFKTLTFDNSLDLDPTPDLHAMFVQYNKQFFWGRLSGCEVRFHYFKKKTLKLELDNVFIQMHNDCSCILGKMVSENDGMRWCLQLPRIWWPLLN